MNRARLNRRAPRRLRRGSMAMLIMFMLMALISLSALSINTVYLEMARSDLQTSVDLATKAGAVALGRFQTVADARRVTRDVMRLHTPDFGTQRALRVEAITMGRSIQQDDGSFVFNAGVRPFNSLQVTATYPSLFRVADIPMPVVGNIGTTIRITSAAVRADNDICLVIDRSASMAWDLSNEPFQYAAGGTAIQNYFIAPDPVNSRWAAVTRTVNTFIQQAERTNRGEVRMGLISFASDYTFGVFESEQATLHCRITNRRRGEVLAAMQAVGQSPLIGDTNIVAGLQQVNACFNSDLARRLTGYKTVILLSDGVITEGGSPLTTVADLRMNDILVHTISFSEQADQALMSQIAQVGGGNHYHAPTEAQLQDAFEDIAQNLQGTLVQ